MGWWIESPKGGRDRLAGAWFVSLLRDRLPAATPSSKWSASTPLPPSPVPLYWRCPLPLPPSPSPPSPSPCPLLHAPPPLSSIPPTADQSVTGFSEGLVLDPFDLEVEFKPGPVVILWLPLWTLAGSPSPERPQTALSRTHAPLDQDQPTTKLVRDAGRPHFDLDARRLLLNGKICKTWDRVASNQWGLLMAFEALEFRGRIKNPRSLDGNPLVDESLRETGDRSRTEPQSEAHPVLLRWHRRRRLLVAEAAGQTQGTSISHAAPTRSVVRSTTFLRESPEIQARR